MKEKKFKCWTEIRKTLNKYGYSYMDMLGYLHLIDISRLWREFEAHIFEIEKIKPKNLRKKMRKKR